MTEHEHTTPEGEEQRDETIDDLDVPEEQSGDVAGGFMKIRADESDAKK
jgi:hypothetical protein